MGLDWITERKPIDGKDKEFIKLWKYLHKLYNEATINNQNSKLIEKVESNLYN